MRRAGLRWRRNHESTSHELMSHELMSYEGRVVRAGVWHPLRAVSFRRRCTFRRRTRSRRQCRQRCCRRWHRRARPKQSRRGHAGGAASGHVWPRCPDPGRTPRCARTRPRRPRSIRRRGRRVCRRAPRQPARLQRRSVRSMSCSTSLAWTRAAALQPAPLRQRDGPQPRAVWQASRLRQPPRVRNRRRERGMGQHSVGRISNSRCPRDRRIPRRTSCFAPPASGVFRDGLEGSHHALEMQTRRGPKRDHPRCGKSETHLQRLGYRGSLSTDVLVSKLLFRRPSASRLLRSNDALRVSSALRP